MSDEPTAVMEQAEEASHSEPEVTVEDILVEEVSIDGMCGVY